MRETAFSNFKMMLVFVTLSVDLFIELFSHLFHKEHIMTKNEEKKN